jgi:hypothetical protein
MTPSDYIPCENCKSDRPNNATHLFLSPGNYNDRVRAKKHWSSNLGLYTYRLCNECIYDRDYKAIDHKEPIDRQDYLAAMAMAAL